MRCYDGTLTYSHAFIYWAFFGFPQLLPLNDRIPPKINTSPPIYFKIIITESGVPSIIIDPSSSPMLNNDQHLSQRPFPLDSSYLWERDVESTSMLLKCLSSNFCRTAGRMARSVNIVLYAVGALLS